MLTEDPLKEKAKIVFVKELISTNWTIMAKHNECLHSLCKTRKDNLIKADEIQLNVS